jgi:crotonobetainyl-CoA:carnitine CoA-transferase CaiB-like acyl-CoA transferase
VIKVEPPSGDPLRRQGPFAAERPHREAGAAWLYLGTRKRGVTLDIRTIRAAWPEHLDVHRSPPLIESFFHFKRLHAATL